MKKHISLGFVLLVLFPIAAHAQKATVVSKSAISDAIEPFVKKHVVPGAVCLVADSKKVLTTQTVGYSDITKQNLMYSSTVFWIASMTKSFTAASIMILVDRNKLKLNDPVSKYLPEFGNVWLTSEMDPLHRTFIRPKGEITIFDLLTHHSGLPNFIPEADPTLTNIKYSMIPLVAEARAAAATPLDSEPGSNWEYSSVGYGILGRIIEVVTGMPYDQFVQENILVPLGMIDTSFSPDSKLLARLAKSYQPNSGNSDFKEVPIPFYEYALTPKHRIPLPSAALFSTASDICRFCQMLMNDGVYNGYRILSRQSVKTMTSAQASTSDGQEYGFGLFSNKDGSYGHNGAFGTIMMVYPSKELLVILLIQDSDIQRHGFGDVFDATTKAVFANYSNTH